MYLHCHENVYSCIILQLSTANVCLEDFADNYSFITQDATHGFHWDASQATLHPFVSYLRPSKNSELKHITCTVISDMTSYNNETVYAFQQCKVQEIK